MPIQNTTESYVIAQTAGDTYNGDESDQMYSINPNHLGGGETITIVDQGGNNRIELVAGLEIVSSIVVANEAQLTLSNGAVINIRGADTFTFNVGQNLAAGDTQGTEKSFAEFAQDILGVTMPVAGADPAEGGASTVNDDGTASPETPEPTDAPTEAPTEEPTDAPTGGAYRRANGCP
ncbi:MAG: hypothetical protein U5L95_02695 [Candidatus Saccharibacteria bacterium]|nr:hypothetical protein [Candidatus Saccharibacteria bacterium]